MPNISVMQGQLSWANFSSKKSRLYSTLCMCACTCIIIIIIMYMYMQHMSYYVLIARFMPRVEIVQKQSSTVRRLYIQGHNGKVSMCTYIQGTIKSLEVKLCEWGSVLWIPQQILLGGGEHSIMIASLQAPLIFSQNFKKTVVILSSYFDPSPSRSTPTLSSMTARYLSVDPKRECYSCSVCSTDHSRKIRQLWNYDCLQA